MKIRLFTSWYLNKSLSRNIDNFNCLRKNLDNPLIDVIHLVIDELNIKMPPLDKKIVIEQCIHRVKFNDYFKLMESYPDDKKIIANADIYFDESLSNLKFLQENECYALTRWDVKSEGLVFVDHSWSQDAWIFKGPLRKIMGDFELGRLNCDGRIAYELSCADYWVKNPSKSIKALHLHSTRKADNYGGHDPDLGIPQPYMQIKPTAFT